MRAGFALVEMTCHDAEKTAAFVPVRPYDNLLRVACAPVFRLGDIVRRDRSEIEGFRTSMASALPLRDLGIVMPAIIMISIHVLAAFA